MLSKKILLSGIALGALAAAGSANALTISGNIGGTQTAAGGVQTALTGGVTVQATATGPYTVANETILANLSQTGQGGSISYLTAALTTPVAAPASTVTAVYQVTFNIGGSTTFKNSPSPTVNVALSAGNATSTTVFTTVSGTQIVALVTVTGGTTAGNITGFVLADTLTPNSQGLAQVSALVSTPSNGGYAPADGGPTSLLNLLTFAPSVNSAAPFTTPAPTVYASLATTPLFQAFNTSAVPNSGTDSTSATFASFNPILNSLGTNVSNNSFYSNLAATPITSVASVIASENVAITGPNIASSGGLTATLGTQAPSSISGNTANFTVNQTTNPNLAFTLTEPSTKVTILAGTYTSLVSYTPQSGFNGPAAATQTVGIVALQGTSITAPWVGDGTNGYQGVVRISNLSNAAIPAFTVTALNPVNSLGSNSATCSFASPGTSTTTVSSSQLNNCFGSFGNSDFRITFPVVSTSLAAKLRIINASTGVVTEQSLGSGQGITFGTPLSANTIIQ